MSLIFCYDEQVLKWQITIDYLDDGILITDRIRHYPTMADKRQRRALQIPRAQRHPSTSRFNDDH